MIGLCIPKTKIDKVEFQKLRASFHQNQKTDTFGPAATIMPIGSVLMRLQEATRAHQEMISWHRLTTYIQPLSL